MPDLRRISGTGPLDINDPNVGPIFVNEAGTGLCELWRHSHQLFDQPGFVYRAFQRARTHRTRNSGTSRFSANCGRGWAVEVGYVGSHFVGGLGIWDPFLATVASPTAPVTVRDINGASYAITTNTVNNEALRHQVLGLSRARGSRYSGNIGFATYNSLQTTALRRLSRGMYFQAAYTFSKTIDNVSGSYSTDELNATRSGQGGGNILNNSSLSLANKARGDFDRAAPAGRKLLVRHSSPEERLLPESVFKGWSD